MERTIPPAHVLRFDANTIHLALRPPLRGRSWLFIGALAVGLSAEGQMTGGVASGMSTPHEVKASELSPSVLHGDVDLFTGRYSASYPLGSVSTPGGLSFALSLQYSPTCVGGNTPNLVDGLLYGDGWNLDLPTITVHNAQRNALSDVELAQYFNANTSYEHPNLGSLGNSEDGRIYWYDVELNIPGVASGRAVFKRFEQNAAVFVLRSFEEPVELRFTGGVWAVHTSDGHVYEFDVARTEYTMPSNQRCMDYDALNDYVLHPNDGTAVQQRQKMINSVSAKRYTSTWYCSRITDQIHLPGEAILFEYRAGGKFDYYKEIQQPAVQTALGLEGMGYQEGEYIYLGNQPVRLSAYETYQEIWLERVVASTTQCTTEEIELEYDSKNSIIGTGMLTPPPPGTPQDDDLYFKESLFRWNETDGFSGWARFPHVMTSLNPAPNDYVAFASPTDPYLAGTGYKCITDLPVDQGIAFDHGFLESPNLPITDLHSGDLIEVRTTVTHATNDLSQLGYFDISLTANGHLPGSALFSPGSVSEQDYRWAHEHELFSTFDRAVKWCTMGDALSGEAVNTSNMFMVPNLKRYPQQSNTAIPIDRGFTLRIGPANSDNNLSMDATDPANEMVNGTNVANAYPSYAHAHWKRQHPSGPNDFSITPPYGTDAGGTIADGVFSHARLPHSFGIGLPWSMMLNMHKFMAQSFASGNYANGGGDIDPAHSGAFQFWWNRTGNLTGGTVAWPNNPTRLGPGVKLRSVEIIRYSRKPFLLSKVRKYTYSGEYESVHATGARRLVSELRVDHKLCEDPMPTGAFHFNLGFIGSAMETIDRYVLSAIRQAPVDATAEVPAVPDEQQAQEWPATYFIYKSPTELGSPGLDPCSDATLKPDGMLIALTGGRLLVRIIDPMGATTLINYTDPTDLSNATYRPITGLPMFDRKDNGTPDDACDDFLTFDPTLGVAASMTPRVSEIRRSSQNGDEADVSSYTFEDPVRSPGAGGGPITVNSKYHDLGGSQGDSRQGFATVTVLGPQALSGERNRTVHQFHGSDLSHDPLADPPEETDLAFPDYLFFGKLKKTQEFGPGIHPIRETETTYGYTKAFENGDDRPFSGSFPPGTDYWFDYFDYQDGFMLDEGTPMTSGADYLQGERRFLESKQWDPAVHWNAAARNSYFIKKTRDLQREWDNDGCVLSSNTQTTWVDPTSPNVCVNAGGNGYTNGSNGANDTYLKNLIAANGMTAAVANTLVLASPLSESVLHDAINAATSAQAADLATVLRAQGALSNACSVQLIDKPGTFPTAPVREVLEAQPYLSDPVLIGIVHATRFSEMERFELLASQPHLSTALLDELVPSAPLLSSIHLRDILTSGPDLPFTQLIAIAQHPALPADLKADILAKQSGLSNSVMYALLADSLHFTAAAMEQVIVHGHHYPSDAFLVALLGAHHNWPLETLRDIIAASDRPLSTSVHQAVASIPGLGDMLPKLGNGWADVVGACGNPCVPSKLAIENITDYSYYEAEHDGTTSAEGYKRLFGTTAPSTQLKWEPSWLLFSKHTWSPQLPEASTTDEYFYYADLRNRYDRMEELMWALPGGHFSQATLDGETHHNVVSYGVYDNVLGDPAYENRYQLPELDYFQRTLEFNLRTSDVYQHCTRWVSPDKTDPVERNEFFEYRASWNEQPDPITYSCNMPTGDTCHGGYPEGGGPGFEHYPPVVGAWYVQDVNYENAEAYCSQVPPGWTLVHSIHTNDQDPSNDDDPTLYFIVPTTGLNQVDSSFARDCSASAPGHVPNACDPVTVAYEHVLRMKPIPGMLRKAFQLYRTDVQADEHLAQPYVDHRWFSQGKPLMEFARVDNEYPLENGTQSLRWAALLPYPTIMKERVIERNAFQQPQVVENERGLISRAIFDLKRYRQHVDAGHLFCNNFFSTILDHPGLPTSMIQGVNWYDPDGQNGTAPGTWQPRPDALTTSFTYKPDNSLASITDPNGKVTAYAYDTFGRLKETRMNDAVTAEYRYHQWHFTGTDPASYAYDHMAATLENHVETATRNRANDESGVLSRTYMDPLGRAFNTIARAVHSTKEPEDQDQLVSSGKTEYDPWGRVISTYNPFVYADNGATFPLALTTDIYNATPNVHRDTRYEMDQRGRPLFTTEPGINISDGTHLHHTKLRYRLLDANSFACELGLSAAEAVLLAPANFANTCWRRTETEDADGHITREYANALGQKVATQAMLNGTDAAVTLFVYDEQGNLAISINPEKQRTTYAYNLLGELYRKTTVDGGTTKYLYDRSGNVVLEQDEELRNGEVDGISGLRLAQFRKHSFDLFNRPTGQSRVRIHAPAANTNDAGVFSYPVDILAYQHVVITQNDLDALYSGAWTANGHTPTWGCDFSCASTQAELATVRVMSRLYTGAPNPNADLHATPILNLLDLDTLPEKQWHYDYAPLASSTNNVPTNTIYGDVGAMLDQARDPAHLRGRLSHTITWPNRTFGECYSTTDHNYHFNTAGEPVLYEFLSYNNEGLVEWQYQQFNPNRISAGSPGLAVRIDHPAYDLRGNLLSQNIDANCDGELDMHYDYNYDGWGRLQQVRAGLSDDPATNELLAQNTYDDAKGRLTHTTYYRTCEEVSFPVDELDYAFDLRDRLTNISGRVYKEDVFYDTQHPTWNGHNLVADHHWNGLINGTRSTYLPEQFANTTDVQDKFSFPTVYGYHYDGLGRLTRADGVQGSAVNGEPWASPRFTVGDERYAYDRIGNITALERYVLPDANPALEGWSYAYQPTTNRLVGAEQGLGSTAAARHYTYDRNGNLTADNFRHLASVQYGRADLPFAFALPNGLQNYEDVDRGTYLYNAADARIYKFIDRHEKGATDANEFYLNDAMGRSLGVLDLMGDALNNENKTSSWDWYVFGGQRFARVHPGPDQQPTLYDADMGRREMADVTNSEYIGVRNTLTALDALPGGIRYPLHLVHVLPQAGPELWLTREVYDSLAMADPTLQDQAQSWYTFTSKKAPVSLKRSNAPHDEVLISAMELIDEGQQRGAEQAILPFHYTYHADTHLDQVYYYEYDHLGNTRATFSDDCKDKNNDAVLTGADEVLEELADYYPYGKMLREFVNGREEKYLTTHHERDAETGLDYRGARYYDADVARFLSLDPLAEAFANINAYNYVFGNPASVVDPDGKGGLDVIVGGVLGFAAAMGVAPVLTTIASAAYRPSNEMDYWAGVEASAKTANQLGYMMAVAGAADLAAGGAAAGGGGALSLSGIGAVVGLPVAATGLSLMAVGGVEIGAGTVVVNRSAQLTRTAQDARTRIMDQMASRKEIQEKLRQDQLKKNAESGHTTNTNKANEQTHEKGDERRLRDRGQEKADQGRRLPRKRPDGWRGPWPPPKSR